MKRMQMQVAGLGLFFLGHAAHAGDDAVRFTPEAQVRPRWELDTGRDGDLSSGSVSYFTMRTRLGGTLAREGVSVRVVLSDVRALGEEDDTRRDFAADGLDVRIAVLGWDEGPWSLRVGRIEESLLNERLLAIANWRQPGRSFDGARLRWSSGIHTAEARALLIEEGDILDFPSSDQVLAGEGDRAIFVLTDTLHADGGALSWSPQVLWDRSAQTEGAYERVTAGLLIESTGREGSPLSWTAEGLGQRTQPAEDDTATLGWMAALTGTLAAAEARLAPHATLQYEILSGTAPDSDGSRGAAFNTLYGANHRYYGNIDVAVFQAGGYRDGQGLQDPALKLGISPTEGSSLALDLHAFFAAQPAAGQGAFLALEPDLSAKVRLRPGLTASAGLNVWLPPTAAETEVMGWAMLDARL